MVCGPEMARLLQEFERATEKSESIDRRHHEQMSHAQIAFQKDVRSLTHAIEEVGNHSLNTAVIFLS